MNYKYFKISLVMVLVIAVLGFVVFDLGQYTSLSYLQEKQSLLKNYYEQNTLSVVVFFSFAYIAATAFSLPAASAFTILSGVIFGLTTGLIIASFASTIGATLAFLIAKYLAKDYVVNRYSKQLKKINTGFKRDGIYYLFALRLAPGIPFFVINIAMALMPITTRKFYFVSQLGMLPGTAIYVFAGTSLSQLESLSDIASPTLLISFALLGIFPIVAKKLTENFRKKAFE